MQSKAPLLRIGTRGSALALRQAHMVRSQLAALHRVDEAEIEIVPITTSGDRLTDRPLSEAGGKGLFSKEIEDALLSGAVDIGVHSSKDLATVLPDGLALPVFLEREDVRDAFVSLKAKTIGELRADDVGENGAAAGLVARDHRRRSLVAACLYAEDTHACRAPAAGLSPLRVYWSQHDCNQKPPCCGSARAVRRWRCGRPTWCGAN